MNDKLRNRDLPAFPLSFEMGKELEEGFWSDYQGLTKLEYAAIQIAAGVRGCTPKEAIEWSFDAANKLFDELEKES